MSSAYYNESGDEVAGVLSPEEVQQQLDDKEVEMQKTIDEAQTASQEELQSIQQQLADKEEEMTKLQDKDRNFGAFRKKSEADKTEMNELKKQIDELKGGLIGQIDKINQVLSDKTISEAVMRVAGGDKEVADKVKFFYNQFSGTPKDEKEMQSRLDNALILATGGKSNVMSGQVYSAGAGSSFANNVVGSVGKWSDEQKDFARKVGITDADIAKYQGKMPQYAGDKSSNKEWLGK